MASRKFRQFSIMDVYFMFLLAVANLLPSFTSDGAQILRELLDVEPERHHFLQSYLMQIIYAWYYYQSPFGYWYSLIDNAFQIMRCNILYVIELFHVFSHPVPFCPSLFLCV